MASEKKNPKYGHLPLSTSGPLECAITGTVLLNHPYFNKGSAFTKEERHDFNLTGLLPQAAQTLEQQANRAYQQYSICGDDLAKNTFMTSMKEQNEVLYYKVRALECVKMLANKNIDKFIASSRPYGGDVQHHLHPHRRRRHSKLFAYFQTPRGLFSQHT